MDLHTRMIKITSVLNYSDSALSSREIAEKYIQIPTSSDSLTTGSILNVMAILGHVKKIGSQKGKTTKYKYQRTGNNMIVLE